MAIVLAKNYVDLLDEVYKQASVTTDLNADPTIVRAGNNANEIVYPVIEVTGLGDYSRSSGYTDGAVSVDWKTATFNYDRGTKIMVDAMDNEETMNIAFGRAGAELMRTQVAPEGDAYTFAQLCADAGNKGYGSLSTAANLLDALQAAKNIMDEAEVPAEERFLYLTHTLHNTLLRLESYQNQGLIDAFAKVVAVPQGRFYSAITLNPGTNNSFGYTKASGARDLNFMIVHKPAVMKFDKHIANDIIPAAQNPDADADILKYRKYGLVDVFYNKSNGVYAHMTGSAPT